MRRFIYIFLYIFIFQISVCNIYAADISDTSEQIIESQFDMLDIDEFSNQLESLSDDNQYTQNFSLKDMIDKIVRGEIDFDIGDIFNTIIKTILKELYSQIGIIRNIIFIACICALAKNLSSSFQSKAVGELAFYICYIVIVILLIQSFRVAIDLTSETVENTSLLLNIFLPVLSTLLVATGNYMSLSIFHPVIAITSEVMISLIKNAIVPFIFTIAVLEIINYISSKEILNKMSELIKKCIGWALKGISFIFMATLTLQKLTVPVVENVINKTAKVAIGAIPVVGEVMVGTVDTVTSWTGLIKNGTVLAVVIFMVLMCAFPILKLVSLIIVYKFTAALIQPISDNRIVKCIDSIASSCQLLLGALTCVVIMFVLVAMMGITILN